MIAVIVTIYFRYNTSITGRQGRMKKFRKQKVMEQSLSKSAYEQIRYKLITGQLTAGMRLSNRKIANELGVSVIPVREAMSQLVSEGLLEHKPKVGTFVIEISQQEMLDMCELRESLECYAARKAAERITDLELEEMEQCLAEMEEIRDDVLEDDWTDHRADRWRLADAGFHLALLRGSGNRRVLKTVSELRVMTYVFGHQENRPSLGDPNRACSEHRRIIDALRKQDADTACAVMGEHLQRASKIVLEAYEQKRRRSTTQHAPTDCFTALLRQRIHKMEEV